MARWNRRRKEAARNRMVKLRGMVEDTATNTSVNERLEQLFEERMGKLSTIVCPTCSKISFQHSNKSLCSGCRKHPNKFNAANNMDPGPIPEELQNLSPLEELLIAMVHPVITVYKTKGSQLH